MTLADIPALNGTLNTLVTILLVAGWRFIKRGQKEAHATIAPESVEIGANQGKYFIFAIPTYTSNGGLEIFFGESEKGEREFSIAIPMKVLLQAKRK